MSASISLQKASTILYSDPRDHYCHRVRFAMFEKGVEADIISLDPSDKTHEVYKINKYGVLPTLIDRELLLYNSAVVMEYLDERFPYPPLLPVYPVAKAMARRSIYHINKDWCTYADIILANKGGPKKLDKARAELSESLTQCAGQFAQYPFFASEEMTLADCCVAPLLWRIPMMNLDISRAHMRKIETYTKKIFQRPAFEQSLSEAEKEMR